MPIRRLAARASTGLLFLLACRHEGAQPTTLGVDAATLTPEAALSVDAASVTPEAALVDGSSDKTAGRDSAPEFDARPMLEGPFFTLTGIDQAPTLTLNSMCPGPVLGAKISVSPTVSAAGANSGHPITRAIGLFTLCHGSGITPPRFPNWSRWYQEDRNTQVFRLFTGEINTHNMRPGHPRVETYSLTTWMTGEWHEWNGTYLAVNLTDGQAIFQVFNQNHQWAMQLGLGPEGNLLLNHRRNQVDQLIGRGMLGKAFDIKVRDNGLSYECYLNGALVGKGDYDRPTGRNQFRWGMYSRDEQKGDSMLFVTGAHVD